MFSVDSGIAARLLAVDSHGLRRPGAPLGPLLEGFVLSELSRQLTWSEEFVELYHYRGQVVGVEIKSASTIRAADFAGLRKVARRLGRRLPARGRPLHRDHDPAVRAEAAAVPISALWELSASTTG